MNKSLLSDVCEIRGRVGWRGYTVEDLTTYGPLVLGANDITLDNQLNLMEAKHITREKYEESPEIMIKKFDILVVKVGSTIGKVCIIKDDIGDACINPNCVIVRSKGINPFYLYYYMCSPQGKSFLINNSSASGQPALNQTDLKKMKIPILEESKQDRISYLLNNINFKIENNNKINSELESIAKTIYDYWFLQFEFPDKEGKPYKSSGGKMVWNEELGREIPEGWVAKKLGDIFDFIKGKIPDKIFEKQNSNFMEYLTIDAVNGGEVGYCSQDSMILTNGEVLMVMDGAASSEVYVGNKGVVGSTFCKLDIKDRNIDNNFLFVIMKKFEAVFKRVNTGSTVPHANKNYINNFKIALPYESNTMRMLQKDITLLINNILINKKQNQHLSSLRDFLLPLLMNGQVVFKENISAKEIEVDREDIVASVNR